MCVLNYTHLFKLGRAECGIDDAAQSLPTITMYIQHVCILPTLRVWGYRESLQCVTMETDMLDLLLNEINGVLGHDSVRLYWVGDNLG